MKIFEVYVPPGKENDLEFIKSEVKKKYGEVEHLIILRRSLDARKSPTYLIRCTDEVQNNGTLFIKNDVSKARPIYIIGAGPAGLFSAIRLIELGLKPIIIERGKNVKDRRLDLANLMKKGQLNTESNYCFGEGGAGTYSDGKLYTRSNKRGSIQKVLDLFVNFGANPNIAIDAHPHIGSNKLPKIISNITDTILDCGGEIHYSTKLLGINQISNSIKGITTSHGSHDDATHVILATGHSARDIFTLCHSNNITIEAKSFALGVRIEHPQQVINNIQYKKNALNKYLPPASYSLVTQSLGKGVYTFCMCPGGIICPASTNQEEVVVNGWSPSTRGSKYANSGLVVEIDKEELSSKEYPEELKCMEFQSQVEKQAYKAGGGKFKAPAQRVIDYLKNTLSRDLPDNSYKPGLISTDLREVLPETVSTRLNEALNAFIKKNPLYGSQDAVLVGVESRTSSPVKIPRLETGEHPSLKGLFPCGEGAGYAGGIVSAAMDGIKAAEAIKSSLF